MSHQVNRIVKVVLALTPALRGGVLFLAIAVSTFACTQKEATQEPAGAEVIAAQGGSIARGKSIYQTQCIACHNSDPSKPGTLGPDVFGSSKELIEARVLRGEYPAGYQPKRQTHTMVPLPQLKGEIESIYLYLNNKK